MAPFLHIMALAALETLRISLPTIVDLRGTVSSGVRDERLDSLTAKDHRRTRRTHLGNGIPPVESLRVQA